MQFVKFISKTSNSFLIKGKASKKSGDWTNVKCSKLKTYDNHNKKFEIVWLLKG